MSAIDARVPSSNYNAGVPHVSTLLDPITSVARSWGIDPLACRAPSKREVGLVAALSIAPVLAACPGSSGGGGVNRPGPDTPVVSVESPVDGRDYDFAFLDVVIEASSPIGDLLFPRAQLNGIEVCSWHEHDDESPYECSIQVEPGNHVLEALVSDTLGNTGVSSSSFSVRDVTPELLAYAALHLDADLLSFPNVEEKLGMLTGMDNGRRLIDVMADVLEHNLSLGSSRSDALWVAASYAGLARSGDFEQFEREVVADYRDGTQDRGIVMPRADELEPWYWPIANKPGDGVGVVTLTGFPDNIRLDGDDMTWRELMWEIQYGEDFEDCNIGNSQTDFNVSRAKLEELFEGRYPVYAYASGEFVQVSYSGQPGGDIGISIRVEPNDITPATVFDQNHLVMLAPGVEGGARVERGQLLGYLNMNLNATDTLKLDTGITIPKSILPIGTSELQRPEEDIEVFHAPFPNAWMIQQYAPADDPTDWVPHRTGFAILGASSSSIDVNDPASWPNVTWFEQCKYPE